MQCLTNSSLLRMLTLIRSWCCSKVKTLIWKMKTSFLPFVELTFGNTLIRIEWPWHKLPWLSALTANHFFMKVSLDWCNIFKVIPFLRSWLLLVNVHDALITLHDHMKLLYWGLGSTFTGLGVKLWRWQLLRRRVLTALLMWTGKKLIAITLVVLWVTRSYALIHWWKQTEFIHRRPVLPCSSWLFCSLDIHSVGNHVALRSDKIHNSMAQGCIMYRRSTTCFWVISKRTPLM